MFPAYYAFDFVRFRHLITLWICSNNLTRIVPASLVLVSQGHANKAFDTCSSILTQLGETVPDAVTVETVGGMIPETLSMYSNVYGDDWLGRKMEDENLRNVVKFYSAIAIAAYFCKPSSMSAYHVCKMVQISLRNGICEYTPIAFMKLSHNAFNKAKDVMFSNAALIQYVFH